MSIISGSEVEINIDGSSIFVMFDPVHATKSMRNDLVEKDLEIDFREYDKVEGSNKKYASWDHMEIAYDMDQNGDSLFKFMPKLTPGHINPKKIFKMKGSCCIEAESETMSNFIRQTTKNNGFYFYFF